MSKKTKRLLSLLLFQDAGSTYFTGYLAAARRLGITSGTGSNTYSPYRKITRQEMFVMLHNIMKASGQLPQTDSGRKLSDFTDYRDIAPWAEDAMMLMAKIGAVSDDKFNPSGFVTRSEMAEVLYDLLNSNKI